jgi:hypothetical protein
VIFLTVLYTLLCAVFLVDLWDVWRVVFVGCFMGGFVSCFMAGLWAVSWMNLLTVLNTPFSGWLSGMFSGWFYRVLMIIWGCLHHVSWVGFISGLKGEFTANYTNVNEL